MQNKLLSLIIPAYNMEDYLPKCLDSLILGSELMESIEVLVINDGSTDATSEIAHGYAEKWLRTFRVIDKENGHYGSCVNRGLKEATGKYVKILDADDWFDITSLEKYIRFLMTTDADMVLTDYNIVNQKGKIKRHMTFNLPQEKLLNVDDFCSGKEFAKLQMHAVTYKREKLIGNEYVQTEGLPYTDQEWIFLPITYMINFTYCPICLYQYLIGREGQTVNSNFAKRCTSDFELVIKRIVAYAEIKDLQHNSMAKIQYLEQKLFDTICLLYKRGLLYKRVDVQYMVMFDKKLAELSDFLYHNIEAQKRAFIAGYPYVKRWRKRKELPFLLYFVKFVPVLRFLWYRL